MIIDQSRREALHALITSPEIINPDDDNFIALLKSTAYRELLNDKIDHYSADSIMNVINAYKEFKFDNTSKEEHRFTNARLRAFDGNYQNHKLEIDSMFNNSQIEAFKYLPADFIYAEPVIALGVLFLEQELAYSLDSGIIINYTNSFDFTEFNQKILSHELHHFYARQICRLTDEIFNNNIMGNIFLFVVQMTNEGMADLITVPYALKYPERIDAFGYKIVNEYKSINENLQNFINILKSDDKTLEQDLLSLRKNGMIFHTLSYYIVNKIYSVYGKDTLCKIIENPLTLFNHYNKAIISLEENRSLLVNNDFISLLENHSCNSFGV